MFNGCFLFSLTIIKRNQLQFGIFIKFISLLFYNRLKNKNKKTKKERNVD